MKKPTLSSAGASLSVIILAFALSITGCSSQGKKDLTQNSAEIDSVSSWTNSIAESVISDLESEKELSPVLIATHTTQVKNAFADGDLGSVEQVLRGARITFTLNKTSIAKYLYLDSSFALTSSNLVSPTSPQPIVGCYVASLKNDRFFLTITSQSGPDVKGLISFNNSQKDSNKGNFVGSFDGVILNGIYSFSSEGVDSRRELFFKATKDGFLSGFGPVEVNGDLEKLKRPLSLKWDSSYAYLAQEICK